MKAISIPPAALPTPSLFLPRSKKHGISSLFSRSEVKSYLLYGYGRIALLDGLRILDCGEGSNVLLPSYNCRTAVEPFRELSIEPRFYTVSLNLEPDIKDIKSKIDKNTKAILAINYFGFPQNIGGIQGICRKHGLYFIEDNAHGPLSQKDCRLLGTFGDIGFSSIWKFLGVPNGAVLFINNDKLISSKGNILVALASQNQLPPVSKKSICTYILNSLLNYFELRYRFRADFIRDIYNKLSPKAEIDVSRLFQDCKVRMSGLSLKIAGKQNLEEVCRKRKENYIFWLGEMLGRKDVQVLFKDLSEGVCPLYFPVIVEEVESFLQEMLHKGIPAYRWPHLPKEIGGNPEYPTANFLAEHVVVLPVHQSVDRDYLARAKSIHRVSYI
ncbi:DegT/DnrJ/EryC1/StrS family aminotransferase [Chloroflexota bacterium]